MNRSVRIALFALLLVGVVGGTVWAAGLPNAGKTPGLLAASHEPEASPAADELARAVDRLKAQGISTDVGHLGDLAAQYGLGGAIRLVAWSDSTGKTVAELRSMRDAGKGWGQMAHELGVSPGIGWIMGNGHAGGNGKAGPSDQQKDHSADADESPEAAESPEESPGS